MTMTDVTEKILINVMGALLSSLPGSVQRKTGKGKVVNRVHSISTSQYENYYSSTRFRKPVTIVNPSGISDMSNSNVKIQSASHGVRVIDVNIGDIIRIYTTDGVLHHYEKADCSDKTMHLAGLIGKLSRTKMPFQQG
jgi:hypothetical protein